MTIHSIYIPRSDCITTYCNNIQSSDIYSAFVITDFPNSISVLCNFSIQPDVMKLLVQSCLPLLYSLGSNSRVVSLCCIPSRMCVQRTVIMKLSSFNWLIYFTIYCPVQNCYFLYLFSFILMPYTSMFIFCLKFME